LRLRLRGLAAFLVLIRRGDRRDWRRVGRNPRPLEGARPVAQINLVAWWTIGQFNGPDILTNIAAHLIGRAAGEQCCCGA